jgi:predicted nucleotidyltransferase
MKEGLLEDKKHALTLVQKRCKQFDAEPLAILFHGSRVSGNSYPGSDWDFYVIAEFEDKPVRPESIYKKSFIDLGFLKYENGMSPKEFIKTSKLVPAQKFEILWARDKEYEDFAKSIVAELRDEYVNSKRETWSDIREHWLETYFYRNIFRISGCKDKLRRQVYIANFLDSIARNQYFHFTNRHNHSISEGYKIIKQNDPSLYRLLVKLPKLKTKRSLKNNLTKIYEYFIQLDKNNPSTMGSSIYSGPGSRLQD